MRAAALAELTHLPAYLDRQQKFEQFKRSVELRRALSGMTPPHSVSDRKSICTNSRDGSDPEEEPVKLSEIIPGYREPEPWFKQPDAAKLQKSPVQAKVQALPAQWSDLGVSEKLWSVDLGTDRPRLLVGFFEADHLASLGYFESMVAVWKIVDSAGFQLIPLGPRDGGATYEEFDLGGIVNTDDVLPLLLYSTNQSSGGLRPIDGYYRVDSSIGIAPAH